MDRETPSKSNCEYIDLLGAVHILSENEIITNFERVELFTYSKYGGHSNIAHNITINNEYIPMRKPISFSFHTPRRSDVNASLRHRRGLAGTVVFVSDRADWLGYVERRRGGSHPLHCVSARSCTFSAAP